MNTGRVFFPTAIACAAGVSLVLSACGSLQKSDGATTDEASAEVSAEAPPLPASSSGITRARRADGLLPGMRRKWHEKTIAKLPSCAAPKLAYFGGPILQNPVVVPVFWSASVNAEIIKNMASFYADITQTSYWTWLHEYDTVPQAGGTGQVILPTSAPGGAFANGATLVPSRCGTTAKCTVTDAQLQSELNAQITAGKLPEPTLDCTGNSNTVYMMHFPPNVTVTGPDGAGNSCQAFCGYHNTGTISAAGTANGKPLIYAVLLDTYSGGCATGCGVNPASGGFTAAFNNQTSIASHELAEAVTDTDIGLLPASATQIQAPVAWYDENNQCGEIGDICDDGVTAGPTIVGAHASWVVQYLWSNKQNKCVASGTVPAICTGTTTTGCRECSCGDNGVDCPSGLDAHEKGPASAHQKGPTARRVVGLMGAERGSRAEASFPGPRR